MEQCDDAPKYLLLNEEISMKCPICKKKFQTLINPMMCELCYSQSCMDDDGGPVRDIKPRPTKGDKKAKRRYNRYRHGGAKATRNKKDL